jgi:hypothetical protein
MIRRLVAHVVVVAAVLMAMSVPAQARGRWGWLDKLSGPGPFYPHVPLFTVTPCAVGQEPNPNPCFPTNRPLDLKFYTTIEIAKWHADTNHLFTRDVDLWTLQGIFYVPLINVPNIGKFAPMHAFDVGAGIGVYSFSGPGVKDSSGQEGGRRSRVSIPIRLRFTPSELAASHFKSQKWRLGLSAFYFRVGFDGLPGSFDESDFFSPPGYAVESSFLDTGAVVIDVLRIVEALRR